MLNVFFFGVGSILGAGIYALVGKVAGFGGNFVWAAFLIASFTALMTAFSYAELSSMFPKSGGEYVYAKKAFGNKPAVFLGLVISFNGIVTGGAVALGFAGYLAQLLEISTLISSLGIIILLFLINSLGIRESSIVNILLTCVEIGGLLFVIFTAIPAFGERDYFELPPQGLNGMLLAAALSFFAFVGFEEIVKLAEETKSPEKNIPRALFISAAIVAVVYVLVTIAAVSMISWEELGKSKSPLADVVSARFGRTGAIILSLAALFATTNTILSNQIGSSRVIYDMADENSFLKLFTYVSPKRKTPVAALVLIALMMCAFALIGDIQLVAHTATLFIFITFLMVNAAVILLRFRGNDIERPYRIPLNIGRVPLPSVIGIFCILVLMGYTIYGLAVSAV